MPTIALSQSKNISAKHSVTVVLDQQGSLELSINEDIYR